MTTAVWYVITAALLYEIRDDIPIMLIDEAKPLDGETPAGR